MPEELTNTIEVDKFDYLHLECTNDKVELKNNHSFVLNSSLFAFQFSDAVRDLITGKNYLTSVHIIPLMPRSIDEYSDKFGEYLTEIIKHIIFKDQTCVDNLIVVTNDSTYLDTAKECIETNSRIISRTGKRFPIVEDTLFDNTITGFNSVTAVSDNESWWIEPSYTVIDNDTIIFEPRHADDYPPSPTDVIDKRGYKAYRYAVKTHKWVLKIKKTYSKNAGNLYSSMSIGEDSLTAYYYEKGALMPYIPSGSEGGD